MKHKKNKDMQLAACIFCDHWDDKNERMKNRLYCKTNCKYRQSYEEFKARQYNKLMFGDSSFGNEWACPYWKGQMND